MFDDYQLDTLFCCGLSGGFSCVALVDKRYFHLFARDFLDPLCQFGYLSAFLLIGGCDNHRQKVSQGVYRGMYLAALVRLYPS